jgi:hypothetical protein
VVVTVIYIGVTFILLRRLDPKTNRKRREAT